MLKAILKNDINYPVAPVYVFNSATGQFEYEEESVHFAIVMNDPDWQVYATNGKLVYPIQNMRRADEEEIYSLTQDNGE